MTIDSAIDDMTPMQLYFYVGSVPTAMTMFLFSLQYLAGVHLNIHWAWAFSGFLCFAVFIFVCLVVFQFISLVGYPIVVAYNAVRRKVR